MAEEIQFFGLNKAKSEFVFTNDSKDNLAQFGIFVPSTQSLTIEDVKSSDPNSFPWPLVAKVEDSSAIIHSWNELLDFADEVRNSDSICFRLPPEETNDNNLMHVCVYVGRTFVCVHNTNTDLAFVSNVSNHKLYDRVRLNPYKVIRLTPGKYGLYLEEVIDIDDERLQPLWKNELNNIGDFFPEFLNGYKLGFSNVDFELRINNHITPESLVGDPYTFGIFFGNKMRLHLKKAFSNIHFSKINKAAFALAKLFFSNEEYQNILNLFALHNKIQSGDTDGLPEMISKQLNPNCKLIIPNTFIACGEGGNYCSDGCLESASLGRHSFPNVIRDSAALTKLTIDQAASQAASDDLHNNIASFDQSSVDGLAIETHWKAKVSQYRIVTNDYNNVSIRMQFSKSELSYKFIGAEDTCQVIVWSKQDNSEVDINLNNSIFNDWEEWVNRVTSAEFSSPSNYRGSDKLYAPLEFRSGIGFCLEDGYVVIPQHVFMERLERSGLIKKQDILSSLME